MSIRGEIERINLNISSAYNAVLEKGGNVPEHANSENIAAAIHTIPTSGSSGTVKWEDIIGRPDISDACSMKIAQIFLLADQWNESNQQEVIVPDVNGDEDKQLIIPVPKEADAGDYSDAGIYCISRSKGLLVFRADRVPETSLAVNIFVLGAAEVVDTQGASFEWWSPHMTSNILPFPYVASGNYASDAYLPYYAFDGNDTTAFGSLANGIFGILQIDLGKRTYIDGIRLKSGETLALSKNIPKRFTLDGSNDSDEWISIYSEDGTRFPKEPEPLTFREYKFKAVKYRYYRVICYSNYRTDASTQLYTTEMEFSKLKDGQ